MNTYPFAGEIKMEKVIKDGKEVIEWEPVPLQSDRFSVDPVTGNVGIGTPSQEPDEREARELESQCWEPRKYGPAWFDSEKFAKLVAAAEREKVAQWMMTKGYATGHGDSIEDLLKELEWQIRESEREACAKVCEERQEVFQKYYTKGLAAMCAETIRARSKQ